MVSPTLYFYPRSPCGERRPGQIVIVIIDNFYPRSPCGERRVFCRALQNKFSISIHALLAESDCLFCVKLLLQLIFLSTLSLRRATTVTARIIDPTYNFYPRSPCGERPILGIPNQVGTWISIHALLAESDPALPHGIQNALISIHALLAESDCKRCHCPRQRTISIHALLAESDCAACKQYFTRSTFLSTLSLRRATSAPVPRRPHAHISIHALLAESDRAAMPVSAAQFQFLSTLSLRRATVWAHQRHFPVDISIHALLAESDAYTTTITICIVSFLSTLSLRRATTWTRGSRVTYVISIHALLAESDRMGASTTFPG